ncbi:ornithine racemase Orr [Clostridiaceae bacterium 35-E11]
MQYPRLEIDLKKIHHNAKTLVGQCKEKGINIAAVTKVFCGCPEIAKTIMNAGVGMLADSRMQNIKKLHQLPIPKMLLRIPMLSEIEDLVDYVDISLNSEVEVMEKISEVALQKNKLHQVILMIDLGDLREGIWENDLFHVVEKIIPLKGIKLIGLGVNFGCYGGIIPEEHSFQKLAKMKEDLEEAYNISLEIVSAANSNGLYLVWEDKIPKGINHLRCGQAIVLGKEDVYDKTIDGLYDDAFRLFGQIVEIKDKPTVPIGRRGIDAFGNIPTFEDKGIRKRAIVAMGRQDILLDGIMPKDEGVGVFGASSDHLLLDITDAKRKFKIGDIVELKMNYGALLAAMTSAYVHKEIIK